MKKRRGILYILLAVFLFSPVSFAALTNQRPQISFDINNGIVRLAAGNFAAPKIESEKEILKVFDELKNTYGYVKAADEFRLDKIIDAAYGKVYKFRQIKDGYNVFGRGLNAAVSKEGKLLSISGNYLKNIKTPLAPEISATEAVDLVINAHKGSPALLADLEIYSLRGRASCLSYNIISGFNNGTRIFVSASTGEILEEIALNNDGTIPSEPFATVQKDYYGNDKEVIIERAAAPDGDGNYIYALADALRNIYILDNKNNSDFNGEPYLNTTGVFNDGVAVTAFLNFVKAFDFYADPVNTGTVLRGADNSVNHIHDDAEEQNEISVQAFMHYGQAYENAGYVSGLKEENPKDAVFIFGDGVSTGLYNPAVALDIVGHEYQHAVTEYAGGLIYQGASGAINEAVSDIFGALIEGYNLTDDNFWLIGEDADFSGRGATRSMKDPEAFGYPGHYDDRVSFYGSYDNGGVHINSNILTHLQYKMYSAMPLHFTKENIGRLWYATLGLLSPDSGFDDFRVMMRRAAVNLGWSNDALSVIDDCFISSGIQGEAGEHTITFSAGTMAGAPPEPITAEYGAEFVIPDCGLSDAGTILTAWSETGDKNSALYYPNKQYRMPAYDMTLFPVAGIAMWNGLEPVRLKGEGKPYAPYLISDAADLATVAYYFNNIGIINAPWDGFNPHFLMTRDIDLENIPWVPISADYVSGISFFVDAIVFDGGGHAVKNLMITNSSYRRKYEGLFGACRSWEIKNLGIESGEIDVYAGYAGGIIGYAVFTPVINCYSKINVTNREIGGVAGGIAGQSVEVMNCYNTGDIGAMYAGGIAGRSSGRFGNCYNTGNVRNSLEFGMIVHGASGIGGIVGDSYRVFAVNCINTGNITDTSYNSVAGGIAGYLKGNEDSGKSFFLGCKNTGLIISENGNARGALIGKADIFASNTVLLEKNHYKEQGGLSYAGNPGMPDCYEGEIPFRSDDEIFSGCFDFDLTDYYFNLDFWTVTDGISIFDIGIEWRINEAAMPSLKTVEWWTDNRAEGFAGGDGSAGNPYQIATAQQLALLNYLIAAEGFNTVETVGKRKYTYADYILTADIDLAGYAWSGIGAKLQKRLSGIFEQTTDSYFSGVFDGAGYTIKNMRARKRIIYAASGSAEAQYFQYVSEPALFSIIENRFDNIPGVAVYNFSLTNINCVNRDGKYAAAVVADLSCLFIKTEIKNIEADGIATSYDTAGGIIANIDWIWSTSPPHPMFPPPLYTHKSEVIIEGCGFGGIVSAPTSGGIIGSAGNGHSYADQTGDSLLLRANVNTAQIRTLLFRNMNFAGGIIGAAYQNNLSVEYCVNSGSVLNISGEAGGIIGSNYGNSRKTERPFNFKISGCKQLGKVKIIDPAFKAGAIIGEMHEYYYAWTTGSTAVLKDNQYISNSLPVTPITDYGWMTVTLDNNIYYDDGSFFDSANWEYFFTAENFELPALLSNRLYYLFNGGYITHTVTFINWDGSVLAEQNVMHRTEPSVNFIPVKESTAQYNYAFSGWDTDIGIITGDLTVRAQYTQTLRHYTYTFYDADGITVLKRRTAEYGTTVTPPITPAKTSTEQYNYTFSGWDTDFDVLAGDITVNAQYTQTLRQYTYTFYDADGITVLKRETADYGTTVTPPVTPAKASTAQYNYTFSGWDTDFGVLTCDITARAQYTQTVRQYTYTFYDSDGVTVLESLTMNYGVIISLHEGPDKEGYAFSGWYADPDFKEKYSYKTVSGDLTLYAKYEKNQPPDSRLKYVLIAGVFTMLAAAVTVVVFIKRKRFKRI